MREILVYDDYEIHKLGAGGGTQYEEVTTEKATSIYVTDVAKPKGKLIPFGRTEQAQLTGKNKCDGIFEQGSISSSGADTLADNRIRLKNYAEVSPSTTYTFKTNSTYSLQVYVFEYDENKDFIQRIPSTWIELPYTFTTSATTKYIRVICAKDNTENISPSDVYNTQLELGPTATDYEEYCGGQASPNPDYPQPIENVEGRSCRNLLISQAESDRINGVEFIVNEDKTIVANGTNDGTRNSQFSLARAVKNYSLPAGTYILNGCPTGGGINTYRIGIQDRSYNTLAVDTGNEATFTLAEETDLNVFIIVQKNASVSNLLFKPMIRSSSESNSAYEPHFEGKRLEIKVANGNDSTAQGYQEQTILFPLAEGQKLMEGDYLADDGIHHIRGKVILDGTENWAGYTDLGTTARVYLLYNGIKKGGNVLCNKLNQTYYDSDTEGIGIYPYQTSLFYIKLNKSRLTSEDIAGIKAWLTSNNLLVEYELAEETIDPYTEAQAEAYNKLKNLMLYKGVNHIWTNTDGLEPNLQLTYKRKKQSNVLQVSNIQPLNNLELNNTEETPEEITTEISEE